MFLYFLGPTPNDIERIEKKYGLENVRAFSKENFYHAIISPQEWIALIDNADLIYTDSFHCAVFSMIFHKPFVVCDRIGDARTQEMRTRLHTLLGRFHQEERFVDGSTGYEMEDPFAVNYDNFGSVLNRELSISDDFVKKAFNL